jgi:CCR4-NOT transcription complex subunit 6
MCYNVLCDKYCTRQLYGYCPPWALMWDYRKKRILHELHRYNADIISLQEVETEQFHSFFQPELEAHGYCGIFSAKSRARTMTESERKHVDGCAIFYRSAKFRALRDHLIEFNQVAIEAADGQHDMINRVMTKDNIGLGVLLETTEAVWRNGLPAGEGGGSKQVLLVATCHVHWDPEFCDVKLIQTMMLMHKLQSIIKDYTQQQQQSQPAATDTESHISSSNNDSGMTECVSGGSSIPLILCGDLNSLPESGVVEYLTSGKITVNHKDFKAISYEDCLHKLSHVSETKDIYSHGFRLAQAYNKDIAPYTNYTFDFKGVIDYIFYSRDRIRTLGVLGGLDLQWFEDNRVVGCPHPQIPSDHFPLFAQFEMTPSISVTNPSAPSSSVGRGSNQSSALH